jgi:hypothetical protein
MEGEAEFAAHCIFKLYDLHLVTKSVHSVRIGRPLFPELAVRLSLLTFGLVLQPLLISPLLPSA